MFKKPANERLFYYTGFAPVIFMGIDYFTLASSLGWIPVKVKYNHAKPASEDGHHGTRQVFYPRYIGWFLAFPWPVVQASLSGNTPLWQMAFNIALTETYVVVMLFAAVVHTTYKWGYFSLALAL
ncbi:ion channel activity [Zygosaccharomyces mellis]|uniref:Ion channel activity n=1 Tax=Zygosaccharomyces mellis TaxID=42258 RepID=A0A4C2E7E3_9SACH|nr:ion channel activity [Zygosaccharomyces mellis]